jgi:putative ABC transport system permease protein
VETLREILSVLAQNKLRTLLAGLSVAWGMFMLALLLGAGRGLENGVNWEFRDDAVNAIWINSGKTSLPFAGRGTGRAVRFDNDDYDALPRVVPGIEHRTGRFYLWGEFFVSYKSRHAAFDIRGTHPGHRFLEKTEMIGGRFLNETDIAQRRKVCVIGSKVRESLFGEQDPLGEYIQIRGVAYRVVGVFDDVGGENELRKIYVPITTAQLIYNNPRINPSADVHPDHVGPRAEQARRRDRARSGGRRAPGLARRSPRDPRREQPGEIPEDDRGLRLDQGSFVWIVGIGTLIAGIVRDRQHHADLPWPSGPRSFGVRKSLGAQPSVDRDHGGDRGRDRSRP